MKKHVVTTVLAFCLVAFSAPSAFAQSHSSSYTDEILQMQPDLKKEDLLSSVRSIAKNTGDTEEAVLKQIVKELKQDQMKASKEAEKVGTMGGKGGTVPVGNSSKGDFFYTASQTAYLNHGHVGMYYTSSTIVESVPDTGVRTISTTLRKVDQGDAQVKSVTTSSANRENAANWAYSRVGIDDYSYNFVTNRKTSHIGDKNCSKLIWSAYVLHGNLDLDVDGGLGVYPRDVRDAPDTRLIRNI
ncbi:hypothetical protein [Fictibacillus phosphorivorans]|uniref:hypothetical protein n=1 Tax=Fictibacillus phosphorivorans TaxID=1221500 RepID=UPI00203CD5A8|nr:hypothetical protein [Fictibacillus phosphorivorans]MCM3720103.1 hypothetical protein [Fictibacillus phosphorivorans]MCM3777793.1 hypothetical protein [Fictibacillus phosphorivorans]